MICNQQFEKVPKVQTLPLKFKLICPRRLGSGNVPRKPLQTSRTRKIHRTQWSSGQPAAHFHLLQISGRWQQTGQGAPKLCFRALVVLAVAQSYACLREAHTIAGQIHGAEQCWATCQCVQMAESLHKGNTRCNCAVHSITMCSISM